MDRTQRTVLGDQRGGHILDHPEAEILQRRNRIGQCQRAAALVKFQPQHSRLISGQTVQPRAASRATLAFRRQVAQPRDVDGGFGGTIARTVGLREGFGIACSDRGSAAGLFAGGQLALDRLGPAADHGLQLGIEHCLFGTVVAVADIEHKSQQSQIVAFDLQAPIQQLRCGRSGQHCFDREPQAGRQRVAREPDEGKQVPVKRRLDQRQARARAIDQAHHRGGDPFQIGVGKTNQQVMGQCGQGMNERLAGMAGLVESELGHQFG